MGKAIKSSGTPAATNTAKREQTKMMGIMVGGLVVLIGLVMFLSFYKQKTVDVVRLSKAAVVGDVITEDMLTKYSMLEQTYTELGTQTYTDESGNTVNGNIYILWKDREKYIEKSISNYVKDGDILTKRDITSNQAQRNPWLSGIKDDEEIYTMKFNASDVNATLLMPGTRIRARLVYNVAASDLAQIRAEISNSEGAQEGAEGVTQSVLMGYSGTGTQAPQFDEEGNLISYGTTAFTGEVAVAEIVIPSITIADMRNSEGESIFDIYSSLQKMPISERMEYLASGLNSSDTASDFKSRVTPVDLTFIVSKEEANMLAEFENTSDSSLKYTILPGIGEDAPQAAIELMKQFAEISNQISASVDSSTNNTSN